LWAAPCCRRWTWRRLLLLLLLLLLLMVVVVVLPATRWCGADAGHPVAWRCC
jgi:hypothetical protein